MTSARTPSTRNAKPGRVRNRHSPVIKATRFSQHVRSQNPCPALAEVLRPILTAAARP